MSRATFFGGTILVASMLGGCGTTLVAEEEQPITERPVDKIAAVNTKLGIEYMREGKDKQAYKRLKKALDIQPDYSGALNAMALLHERLGKTELAESHFERAVRSNPGDAAAYNNFGAFLCRQGRVQDAMEQFKQALQNPLNKAPAIALNNAGQCLAQSGHSNKAEGLFREALRRNPKLPSALLAMSELSEAKGSDLAARGYLQR